jgi:methionyl-tRNA formyltransferase
MEMAGQIDSNLDNVKCNNKLIFFGSYLEVLHVLMKHFDVLFVVVETQKVNSQILTFCDNNKLHCLPIKHLDDLRDMACQWHRPYGISASFGLIFKQRHIDWFSAIYNFHPGCLYHNRGRHPLPNAIAHHHPTMALSVHQITDEAIDAGGLVSRIEWVIDYRKSYWENYDRLLNSLTYLTEDLCHELNQGYVPVLPISPAANSTSHL